MGNMMVHYFTTDGHTCTHDRHKNTNKNTVQKLKLHILNSIVQTQTFLSAEADHH